MGEPFLEVPLDEALAPRFMQVQLRDLGDQAVGFVEVREVEEDGRQDQGYGDEAPLAAWPAFARASEADQPRATRTVFVPKTSWCYPDDGPLVGMIPCHPLLRIVVRTGHFPPKDFTPRRPERTRLTCAYVNGTTLAVGDYLGTVSAWDIVTEALIFRAQGQWQSAVIHLNISQAHGLICCVFSGGGHSIWDLNSQIMYGIPTAAPPAHSRRSLHTSFSPAGTEKRLALCNDAQGTVVVNLKGDILHTFPGVHHATFAPNGALQAFTGAGKGVCIELPSGAVAERWTFSLHSSSLSSSCWFGLFPSRLAQQRAVLVDPPVIYVLDLTTWREISKVTFSSLLLRDLFSCTLLAPSRLFFASKERAVTCDLFPNERAALLLLMRVIIKDKRVPWAGLPVVLLRLVKEFLM